MDLSTVTTVVAADRFAATEWRAGDAWLAGGTWLFSQPQPHLDRLIDLRAFGWPALTVNSDGLELAATCTVAWLHDWSESAEWAGAGRLIRDCCQALLASWKVWHHATVGGNLCLAQPAGSLISFVAALDGSCTIRRPDGSHRSLPATEFVTGVGANALRPGELLRSVQIPERALRARTAVRRMSLSPHGRSAAHVAGRHDPVDDTTVVTITAAVTRPLQLRFAAPPSAGELRAAIDAAAPAYHDNGDGDPRWRAHIARRLAEQVCAELVESG